MTNQINYDFFLKLDKWTKKDAALILSGHDPADYKNLRFSQNDLPSELVVAQQLYRIFCSINFREKYGRENYPLDYFLECHRKGIVLSEPLLVSARHLFAHLQKFEQLNNETEGNSVDMRERNYLLKIIGALTSVYCHEKIKPSRTKWTKVSVAAVVEDILQYVSDHELASNGLGKSNLHKKISEGIAAFDDDFQTHIVQLLS
jgi:hypothetical protein